MGKFWISLGVVTLIISLIIYFVPISDQVSFSDKKWMMLMTIVLTGISAGLFLYAKYIVNNDDAYSMVSSVYLMTLSKFIAGAIILVSYIYTNPGTYSKPVVFGMMGIYLVYQILISIFLTAKNKS